MWPSAGGILSVLLIFPGVVLAAKWAGASPIEKTRARRVSAVIVLGFCVLLAVAIPILSLLAFWLGFLYTVLCAVHIVRQGVGFKRFLIGASVVLWMLLCAMDYGASFNDRNRLSFNEVYAFGTLRTLATAEKSFAEKATTRVSEGPTFATVRELRANNLVQDDVTDGKPHNGYIFGEIADPTKRTFLLYAIPAHYPQGQPYWSGFVPGAALWFDALHRDVTRGTGRLTMAVDDTDAFRSVRARPTPPITREQVAQWPPI